MNRTTLLVLLLHVWWLTCQECLSYSVTRGKDYRSTSEVATTKETGNSEPSCEELKAMWRFSKRQSRAAEITNEIPRYRDPFTYNLWEPTYFARSRSMGGMKMNSRHRGNPIIGRVVHKAPVLRSRAFEDLARLYGTIQRGTEQRRKVTAFRLPGGGHIPALSLSPQTGSFQHLKELIRKERARELQEQRMAEELSAGALKELSGGLRNQANLHDMAYLYDTDGNNEHENVGVNEGLLAFPDLLAPASTSRIINNNNNNNNNDDARYVSDFSFPRDSPRHHTSSLYDSSSFNNDFDGYML